ncbi:MAG: hypothetical protein E7541_00475 [Ruminococcaceae bacterium]|nr:hypothetical protein [Oscillospiraceae bacterium]
MNRHKLLTLFLSIVLLTTALTACSGGSSTTSSVFSAEGDTASTPPGTAQKLTFNLTATVIDSTDFTHGFAWLQCKDENGNGYVALVNADQQTLYSAHYNKEILKGCFGKTLGYYMDTDSNGNDFYVLVNTKGEKIASSLDGTFDKVLACGEQNVFVYKNSSDYAGKKHLYGFIDESGEWAFSPFELKSPFNGYTKEAAYINCGMYRLGNTQYSAVINSATGSIAYLEDFWHFILPVFNDNKAVFTPKTLREMTINGSRASGVIILSTDGSFVCDAQRDRGSVVNNFVIRDDDDNKTTHITNHVTGTTFSRSDLYSCANVSLTYFENGKSMLQFYGADHIWYFSIIDEKGNTLVEPTPKIEAEFSEGIVVYSYEDSQTHETLVKAIDSTGKVLFEDKPYITSPFAFHHGIGRVDKDTYVQTAGNRILVDTAGNRILETIRI